MQILRLIEHNIHLSNHIFPDISEHSFRFFQSFHPLTTDSSKNSDTPRLKIMKMILTLGLFEIYSDQGAEVTIDIREREIISRKAAARDILDGTDIFIVCWIFSLT